MQHHQILKQHPFSLYDFLGYLIPSTIFFASIIFLDLYLFENCCGISCFLKDLQNIEPPNKSIRIAFSTPITEIALFLLLIFSLYVCGQMLGILSSYLIEKGYYVKKYGYPGGCLLSPKEQAETKCKLLSLLIEIIMLIKTIMFNLLNLFCIPIKHKKSTESCNFLHLSSGLIMLPITIALCILKLLEIKITHKNLFDENEKTILKASLQKSMKDIIGNLKLTKEQIDIKEKIKKNEYYSFKMIYHNVIEVECPHLLKIYDCMCLYGFFRNLTLSFLLIFWITLGYYIFHTKTGTLPSDVLFCLLLFPALSLISFLGFHKFYTRYAKEVLYASLVNKPDNSDSGICKHCKCFK
jgi:hypothetical protein